MSRVRGRDMGGLTGRNRRGEKMELYLIKIKNREKEVNCEKLPSKVEE